MTVMGSSGYTGPPDSTTLMMPDFRSSLPSGVPLGTMSCTCNRRKRQCTISLRKFAHLLYAGVLISWRLISSMLQAVTTLRCREDPDKCGELRLPCIL